jgi:very-short-patch-repair endonuclease
MGMKPVPDELLHRPFSRAEARALGITDRMLSGRRFVRVLPTVFRHRNYAMTSDTWVTAARLALPARAQLTGITRIQQLGLDYGPRLPVRFVIEGDHHLALDQVFLHRTRRLPPTDDVGVTPAAAYLAYCRRARVIDAIKVGDWLLHRGHATKKEIHDLALSQQWRDGAAEALWVYDYLDERARSLPESECRALLTFSGLPPPGVNRRLPIDDVHLISDLVFAHWRTVVEYEGSQHQQDRGQYTSDIDRYASMRRHDIGYVQVTAERLQQPRIMVGEVYRELRSRGYEGPPPAFGRVWFQLFRRISQVMGPRLHRRRAAGE